MSTRPAYRYQWIFTTTAVGLLLLVTGLIGLDLSGSYRWFEGTRWVDSPVWWQVAVGLVLLLIAVLLVRRVRLRETAR